MLLLCLVAAPLVFTTTSLIAQTPAGVLIERDVPYLAPDRAEKADLYLPEKPAFNELRPAVVIIHGGGWVGGDKAARRELITGTTLALAGYVCMSVEYMKEAGKRWPQNIQDCKNAVRWLRVNADKYHIDTERIGVIGGSAGGHLALLVAYTPGLKELEPQMPYPGISDRVEACVDMYGITNLLTRQRTDEKGKPNGELREAGLFEGKRGENLEKWKLASPVNHVSKASPPTLIIHGTADTTVDRDQSSELASKLAAMGVEHRLIPVPDAGHAFALKEAGFDLRGDVVAFFDKHLKQSQPAVTTH